MATTVDLAKLSLAVYTEAAPPEGWIVYRQQADSATGYFGIAYRNT